MSDYAPQRKIDGCFLFSNKTELGSNSNCNYVLATTVIFGFFFVLVRLLSLMFLASGKINARYDYHNVLTKSVILVVSLYYLSFLQTAQTAI